VATAGAVKNGRLRVPWRRVDGVLLLDKAPGLTSNAALQAARRLYRAAKAGHTGTLDPLATGLLPVLFGEATKFGGELLDADKTYAAAIALGATTTTGDAEGEVVERQPVAVTRNDAERVLAGFRGAGMQVPPMYSALKRDGRPLYEYARAGQSVDRPARPIRIDALMLDALDGTRLAVTVRASKGTYIRVLAEDIGRALGCGAHLAQLRRLAIGPFSVADAATLDALEALAADARDARLLPLDALVGHLPLVTLGEAAARRFAQGQSTECPGFGPGRIRAYGPDKTFLGVGAAGPDGRLQPRRLIRTDAAPAAAVAAPKTL
jgi:tRNA pseudouridine55 synthase